MKAEIVITDLTLQRLVGCLAATQRPPESANPEEHMIFGELMMLSGVVGNFGYSRSHKFAVEIRVAGEDESLSRMT